ncbi:hypothetical protein P368_04750 [Comamonas thiooxydans]|nr:hypothetical protein P368_04750 [Comamonas thiooxydans]
MHPRASATVHAWVAVVCSEGVCLGEEASVMEGDAASVSCRAFQWLLVDFDANRQRCRLLSLNVLMF